MIDGLVSGRLYGAPQDRTAQNGKTFVTAKMRATRYVSNDTKSSPPKRPVYKATLDATRHVPAPN